MASLMETLIDVLHRESELYEELYTISSKKTPVIISGDLPALADITEKEQAQVDRIASVDREREVAMRDIADVLNKDYRTMRLTDVVGMLDKRPQEQARLAREKDALVESISRVRQVNDQNQVLLKSSLEMVEFEMNVLKASDQPPETNNYSRRAGMTGDRYGIERGSFNAGA